MTKQPKAVGSLPWSAWIFLEGCWRGDAIPAATGLYRIRRVESAGLDYIGQTGSGRMNLRARIRMLKGTYGPVMPYRDPHTAGPALWALRQLDERPFEVSVAVVEDSTPWRKGLEALAIGLYRQEAKCSPTVNFGRMPCGYRMSSANNARLVAVGKRFRGGPTAHQDKSHHPGVAPAGPLEGSPLESTWCGHEWSPWTALEKAIHTIPTQCTGLYRLRGERPGLVYIGQGRIRARLRAHAAKMKDSDHCQGAIFAAARPLQVSWVAASRLAHQRLKLETDLIGAYVFTQTAVPEAQFRG